MDCDVQDLLDRSVCLAAAPPFLVGVVQAEVLCDIAQGLVPEPIPGGSWWNPDVNSPIVDMDSGGIIVNPDV